MGKGDRIDGHQLAVLTFISLLSPLMRILPGASVALGGGTAWLSPLPALAAGGILVWILGALLRGATPGRGLDDMALLALGPVIGRVFCVISALWLTFYAGFIARAGAERLLSTLYPAGNTAVLIVFTLLAAVIAASGAVRSLAGTAEVFLPMLVLILAVVVLAAGADVNLRYLLPVTYLDAGGIALGAIPIFDVMALTVFFLFLRGYVEPCPAIKRRRFPTMTALALTALAVLMVTVGTVSADMVPNLQNAFFVVIRNVQLLGVIERVEAVVIAVWVVTDFTMLAALLTIASRIWRTVLGTGRRRIFVAPGGILAGAAAFLIAPDAFSFQRWSNLLMPLANTALAVGSVILVLGIGKLRKKL